MTHWIVDLEEDVYGVVSAVAVVEEDTTDNVVTVTAFSGTGCSDVLLYFLYS